MFSNLGLFKEVGCPDPNCQRKPCLFSHNPILMKEAQEGTSTSVNRAVSAQSSSGRETSRREDAVKARPLTNAHEEVLNNRRTTSGPSKIIDLSGGSSDPVKPVLKAMTRLTRQPLLDRKKALEKLFTQYCSIYAYLLPANPSLAADHALAEEQLISNSTNTASYGSAIHSACIRIKERQQPRTLSSEFVGTNKDVKEKIKQVEEERKSELTVERIGRFCLTRDQMKVWGYPIQTPVEPGGIYPDCMGETKSCDRCAMEFQVAGPSRDRGGKKRQAEDGMDNGEEEEEDDRRASSQCIYHWGRQTIERVDGARMARWSCCGAERNSRDSGCTVGDVHVFKDGKSWRFSGGPNFTDVEGRMREDEKELKVLHSRVGFQSTKKVIKELQPVEVDGAGEGAASSAMRKKRKRSEVRDIVAMDCEMIYTSGGMSLARVSLLDQTGKVILDECVRQTTTILDLNEKFSGLAQADMDNAKLDIHEVRRAVCKFIDEDSIMIGHGLENDLKALRLIHRRVIDTAVLFPHQKGPPFRRALKDLSSERLGVFIQNNVLEEGHDSSADARAALNLVKWKVGNEAAHLEQS